MSFDLLLSVRGEVCTDQVVHGWQQGKNLQALPVSSEVTLHIAYNWRSFGLP
jgi:hypothetical protein